MAEKYSLLAKLVHWLSALAVFALFASGVWMVELNYYHAWYRRAPELHMSFGVLLFAITLVRLWLRRSAPAPLGTPTMQLLAHWAHRCLILLVLVIPITGYLIVTADERSLMVFDWFALPSLGEFVDQQEDVAGEIHEILAYSLIGLAVLHALAALKHHFVDKDNTLKRMISH